MSYLVHHLNCGTMCPHCARLFDAERSLLQRGRFVCHCLLVETPRGLVLVDTGLGTADVSQARQRLGRAFVQMMSPVLSRDETAIEQIRALGYSPGDVQHILPTHLDPDHAGGLSDFPQARVHVYRPELHAALVPRFPDNFRFRAAQFNHGPLWAVHDQPTETFFGLPAIRPVADLDILMVPLVGHTRGHVGVAVKHGQRWVLHCGDSYYHRAQLSEDPIVPIGIEVFQVVVQTLPDARKQSLRAVQALARAHSDEIDFFCAHDPVEFERMAGQVA
jgi:glyoxylase-like metal-dependent hydrolase (beta-lactamase superfamily II)